MDSNHHEKSAPPHTGHILAIPYPSQGHINPMLQLCKRVFATHPTIKSTFAVTTFIASTFPAADHPSITIAAISDGFDSGGFSDADSVDSYLAAVASAGRKSLADLIRRLASSSDPVTCVVYDAFSPWALDVAKDHGLPAVAFFTQPCTVNYVYYLMYRGVWSVDEVATAGPVKVPGTEVELEREDLPSFVGVAPGSYPGYFRLVLNQHLNIDKAECILVNTFFELEPQVVDSMSKHTPLLPIGPTIPSFYLDQEDPNDNDYGLHLFNFKHSTTTTAINWLNTKPSRSAIYVSFGSLSDFKTEQLEEVVWALKDSEYDFLWALRATEQPKLPKGVIEEMSSQGKCMLVDWCTQLEVLANGAIGCFLTHCGWNSTQEALSLGVPMVAIPQWTDQPTNAKLVQDVWKVGFKTKAGENGIVSRDEIGRCLREVMCGEKGREMRDNARRWRDLAKGAFARGGSSDRNIDVFLSKCVVHLKDI